MINFNEVSQNLYVGSCPRTNLDVKRLAQGVKISAILNLQTDDDFKKWRIKWDIIENAISSNNIVLVREPIIDFDAEDLALRIHHTVSALERLLLRNHRVYVHCTAGVGRAPSIVAAHLAWYQNWDMKHAIDHLLRIRKCAPNAEVLVKATQSHQAQSKS